MASSISAIGIVNAAGAAGATARFALKAPAPQQLLKANNDDVTLTLNARIHLLQQEGQTASQISAAIPEPIATVNQDLDVTTTAADTPATTVPTTVAAVATTTDATPATSGQNESATGQTINLLT